MESIFYPILMLLKALIFVVWRGMCSFFLFFIFLLLLFIGFQLPIYSVIFAPNYPHVMWICFVSILFTFVTVLLFIIDECSWYAILNAIKLCHIGVSSIWTSQNKLLKLGIKNTITPHVSSDWLSCISRMTFCRIVDERGQSSLVSFGRSFPMRSVT